jgi:hypothetical protein
MGRPLIGGKDFNISIGQGEQAQGGVRVFFVRKKEENECGREKIVLMCEKMLFMEKKIVFKQRAWKEIVCGK